MGAKQTAQSVPSFVLEWWKLAWAKGFEPSTPTLASVGELIKEGRSIRRLLHVRSKPGANL
jgi:hypothetical protein